MEAAVFNAVAYESSPFKSSGLIHWDALELVSLDEAQCYQFHISVPAAQWIISGNTEGKGDTQ